MSERLSGLLAYQQDDLDGDRLDLGTISVDPAAWLPLLDPSGALVGRCRVRRIDDGSLVMKGEIRGSDESS